MVLDLEECVFACVRLCVCVCVELILQKREKRLALNFLRDLVSDKTR